MPTPPSVTDSDFFTSRWGVIVAGIGMAVGAGNLWRFPRIVAENGGGAFLIPWLLFLFIWSIPLLIAEFGLGRGARRGPIGSFAALVSRRTAWMGGFVVVTTVMIMFYYSVVTGWALKYFTAALAGDLASGADTAAYWETYSGSMWQPILFHVAAIAAAGAVVARGVTRGIERANRILIPTLFVLLLLAVARAVTLPGAGEGLRYLFVPDLARLADYRTWLEALTQSAWSTGAGWGLMLSYAVYVRRDDDVVSNAVSIGLGNNLASILAAMAILPAVFAILPTTEALGAMAAGNTGLSFIWIPQVFARMPAGGDLPAALLSHALLRRTLLPHSDGGVGGSRPARWWPAAQAGRRSGGRGRRSLRSAVRRKPAGVRKSGLGLGTGTDGERVVHRHRRDSLRRRPLPHRSGQHERRRTARRTALELGAHVAGADRVRRDVYLVDVPVGDRVRPRGMVASDPGLQHWHVRRAVGDCADHSLARQPPTGGGKPCRASPRRNAIIGVRSGAVQGPAGVF